MIQPDATGLYHPGNEDDIIELIQFAIKNKLQVRVQGAAQSATGAVFTDDGFGKNINMELDQLRSVSIDEKTMQVTVGGGCNLGFNPFDPSKVSDETNANNLYFQLNEKGLSIPIVTNAIQQTVAGFISTGTCSGTMQHSFDECMLSLRMIDGNGKVQTFTKSNNLEDDFYGVVVSMGLLGIITEVTLQCQPSFNITGNQLTTDINKCEFNFFNTVPDTRKSLQQFLADTEFTRILWWPYNTMQRAITWQAKTMLAADYNSQTGSPADFKPKPYQPIFPPILGNTLPSEAFGATAFELIATWPKWFYDLTGNDPNTGKPNSDLEGWIEKIFPYAYPLLTDMYFPENSATNPGQIFWDNWLGSLPVDKIEYGNNLFQLVYSEMWIPSNLTTEAINTMQQFYVDNGYSATGFYTVEILAAKQSNFWLSPAYQTDVTRINILYFTNSTVSPEDYFTQFWNLLAQKNIPFRPHWGKNLPLPTSSTGPSYLQSQYPKWQAFMNLRKQMDPNNIFLTSYWQSHLGIN